MKEVIILGNGVSRLKYKTWINKWNKEIWVCNKAYQEKDLPYINLVGTVHSEIAISAMNYKRKHNLNYKIYTSKNTIGSYEILVFPHYRGWSTGNELICLALMQGYEKIYLLGFDMGGPDIYQPKPVIGSNFRKQLQSIILEFGGNRIEFINESNLNIPRDKDIEIIQKVKPKINEPGKKIIQQYHKTKIAYAPQIISDCINKYSKKYVSINSSEINPHADLIHFHNKWEKTDKPAIIQYHSQPYIAQLEFPKERYCIAQYPAVYKAEYNWTGLVRNIIDLDLSVYKEYIEVSDKIKVAYTPSTIGSHSEYADKGYAETIPILERLKKKYPDKFDFTCITRKPLAEALRLKKEANIVIDECKTGSYHRCTLEGLAMGKLTIVYVNSMIENMFKSMSQCDNPPYENVHITKLEKYLVNLIENYKINYILEKGQKNYMWMKKYWNHIDIINEFEMIYNQNLKDVK